MPFSVVRSDRRPLVEQVVDGVKRAVETGKYAIGSVIPSTRDMAEMLGVSRIVTRSAVRRLADAGYLSPRPGVGSVVLGRNGKLWRGTVLFVAPSDRGGHYVNTFAGELRTALVRGAWRFVRVSATNGDTSLLELEVAHPVDLAIVMFKNPAAERVLSKAGIPFVSLGNVEALRLKGCVAAVPFDRGAAADGVADRAKALGVKTTWQVGYEPQADLMEAFAKRALSVREVLIAPKRGEQQPEATVHAVQAHFERLLAEKGKSALPDLLYFADDYVCQGALLALTRNGLEAPRDVKVVSWANEGNGPYYLRPLARVAVSPRRQALKLLDELVPHLTGRRPFGALKFGTAFEAGETF